MYRAFYCLFLIVLAGTSSVQSQDKKPAIGTLDPEMAERKKAGDGLDWYDVTSWKNIEGRILPDQERVRWFDRVPAVAEKSFTNSVWYLSRHSAGMMVRFNTNATEIHIHYKLLLKNLSMSHMPATGVSGVDFYARDENNKWRWVQVTRPTTQEVKTKVVSGMKPGMREFAAYLPLYNGVEFMSIGVPPNTEFEKLEPRKRPIVFYGTSITHGACASRPGIAHTAILGRKFDMPVVNLGFSGNGKMDLAVGEIMSQIDASVYVIDCLPNMSPSMVTNKCVPLIKQIRAAKPDTPIVLVEDRRNTNSWILPGRDAHHTANHAALRKAYDALKSESVKNLFYIPGDTLYGNDTEGATDGSHANDLGFMRQAEAFEPILKQALELN